MLLGVEENSSFEEIKINLEVNDFIAFFTDGVTEAINDKNEEYSQKR